MKVQFTKSPTGKYLLGYSVGDITEIDNDVAEEMIESGFAIAVEQDLVQDKKKGKAGK